jgi:hypothetical protein
MPSLELTVRAWEPIAQTRRSVDERAQDNLRRYKAKQPLVGHLLPYLTGEEGKQHGLHFHEEHGWVVVP